MNYSNTVVMHAPKEKLRRYTRENILYTYIMSKILRKIGKENRIAGKKKGEEQSVPHPAIAIGSLEEPLLNRGHFALIAALKFDSVTWIHLPNTL